MKCEVVLKYSEALDQFLQMRIFDGNDIDNFLRSASFVHGRSAYQTLVIQRTIVGAEKGLKALLDNAGKNIPLGALAEHLYHLCVDTNPSLEIHQVTVPGSSRKKATEPKPTYKASAQQEQETESVKKHDFLSPDKILGLESMIRKEIIGQDDAIDSIVNGIKRAAFGMHDNRKPLYTALLVGPTGVGKTETAKALTRGLFGDLSRLVRVDCSEYALPHEYAKLIGAPPGYIGYNEGGFLTETVKEKRHAVVLFDEVEKAHSKVHHLLLQLLDEGFLGDGKGVPTDFTNTIVIMTTNLGAHDVNKLTRKIGYSAENTRTLDKIDVKSWDDTYRNSIRNFFRPEFLNRVGDILIYHAFRDEHIKNIAIKKLDELVKMSICKNIGLSFSSEVIPAIISKSDYANYGAREIERIIEKQIANPLADKWIHGELPKGNAVVSYKNNVFNFLLNEREISAEL